MSLVEVITVPLLGYLLGSVSFAVLIARAGGVDILREGSGSPGATNVKRTVGNRAGNLCFALDAAKGFAAAGWPCLVFSDSGHPLLLAILGLVGALVGHSFSIFLRFRGGKGVAVTMGGLSAIMPWSVLIGICVWLVLFYTFRYVSLASLGFGFSLPLSAWFLDAASVRIWLAVALALLIVVRHISNIKRLWAGTEHRFDAKRKRASIE